MGKIFLGKSDKGLIFAEFMKNFSEEEKTHEVSKKWNLELEHNENKFAAEKELFDSYFGGKRIDFTSLSLDLIIGTPFQKKVWLEARKIPFGKTETYKSLAHKMNHKGYRSIGQALSKNPLLIIVPCHRVLASDDSLGGFSAGLELKEFLLSLEKGN